MKSPSKEARRDFLKLTLPATIGVLMPGQLWGMESKLRPNLRSGQALVTIPEAVLEDFSNIVTSVDFGFNQFSGNTGGINKNGKPYGQSSLVCETGKPCRFRLNWNFSIDQDVEAFTGVFHSLFGLTDTQATFDGQTIQTISFPEHVLDLDNVDGVLVEPGGRRSFQRVLLQVRNPGSKNIFLRIELKDTQGGGRFTRFLIKPATNPVALTWNFRSPANYKIIGGRDLNLRQSKVLNFVIERSNVADRITNPVRGTLDFHRISFVPNRPAIEPVSDTELLDLLERRSFQYFLDWSSRKPASLGIPQDRSTFNDLLTVGGGGFALPALAIGAERGWISRTEAITRARSILRLLSNATSFGPDRIGRIGHRGFFYHFLGIDGRRKLNFDFPGTSANESLNTVELSTIDTGLALMGVLAAQSYFDRTTPEETEIRTLAQTIYDQVDWPFLLEPGSHQFYLGWKPNELREGPPFNIPDAQNEGGYSSRSDGSPATLDFYTDEASIVTLLAVGSQTHPVPISVHCAWQRDCIKNGIVTTYPGSLFTYQFLHAFLNTQTILFPACPGENLVNWYENSRQAMLAAMQYATQNPEGFATYGPTAWGITAAEGPDDGYYAYGAPPIACNPVPDQDGTIAYYGMINAVSFGTDWRTRVIAALRQAWQRGHWHWKFGLPDAFNNDISQRRMNLPSAANRAWVRSTGTWVQRALFAIDQGPMLLHLENARSGLIWRLIERNPNIQRSLARLNTPRQYVLEAEQGTGQGQLMTRSNASNQTTVLLLSGQTRTLTFQAPTEARYQISVRYSNDNFGALETVALQFDNTPIGSFSAQDTGDFGNGWNIFQVNDPLGPINVLPGNHQLTVSVSGGDSFGVELDVVKLDLIQ